MAKSAKSKKPARKARASRKVVSGMDSPIIKAGIVFVVVAGMLMLAYVAKFYM